MHKCKQVKFICNKQMSQNKKKILFSRFPNLSRIEWYKKFLRNKFTCCQVCLNVRKGRMKKIQARAKSEFLSQPTIICNNVSFLMEKAKKTESNYSKKFWSNRIISQNLSKWMTNKKQNFGWINMIIENNSIIHKNPYKMHL